jgi:hypothetical protein
MAVFLQRNMTLATLCVFMPSGVSLRIVRGDGMQ